MLKEKIMFFLAGIMVVLVAGLGYLFFEYYTSVRKSLEQQSNESQAEPENKNNSIYLGELPSAEPGKESLPITSGGENPQTLLNIGSLAGKELSRSPAADFLDTSQWKTYTNKKYNYSFKYPKEFDYSSCGDNEPCKYGQVYEKDGGDIAWLNGAVNNQSWPFIIITHRENESYTLPKNVKFFDWLAQKFGWTKDNGLQDFNLEIPAVKGNPKKAVRIGIPQTPQAYAREEIYFETGDKIFQIQLMDSNKVPAREFYNKWLETFTLL